MSSFEYDLKSGSIIDLNLSAANRPDVRDACYTSQAYQIKPFNMTDENTDFESYSQGNLE